MSGPTSANGARPARDKLLCLKQAGAILKLVEALGRAGDFDDSEKIVDIVKSARTSIEEVIEARTAHFAARFLPR